MSDEELKKWFFDMFNDCYPVKHEDYPHSIFWYYDKSFVRNIKLCKINNKEVTLPSNVSGICLFEHNSITGRFNCDYDEIWLFLEQNYSFNYFEIRELIIYFFKETEKLSIFTSLSLFFSTEYNLVTKNKLSALKPDSFMLVFWLEEVRR